MMNAAQMNNALAVVEASDRYVAGSIAWNDGQRGVVVVNGVPTLSSLGANITDCCIVTEDGGICQYIKPPNMDETLGVMDAKDILMVDKDGTNVSVQDVLDDLGSRSKYMGYTSVTTKHDPNQKVVVRFHTAWVPIKKGMTHTEIAPQHYSYQTRTKSNPRNLLVLGTPQGVFVHSDGPGGNKLFAHSVAESGEVRNHWFKAEANTDCLVGHAATREEDGIPSKKARSVEMGIRGMGLRTNCFVTVSVPNKQTVPQARVPVSSFLSEPDYPSDDDEQPVYRSLGGPVYRTARAFPVTGVSYAARVSVATESVGAAETNQIDIERPDGEPIVVTILTYNTIEVPDDFEGDPTFLNVAVKDVALGVADLDKQYDLVKKNGGVVCKLSELPAMLHKLTTAHTAAIVKKVTEDPPPNSVDPMMPQKSALSAFA